MTKGLTRSIATLILAATLAIGGSAIAEARPGWFVGGGLDFVSGTGDLDGSTVFGNSTQTEIIVAGKPSAGRGFQIEGGYGFNQYVSVEALVGRSHHTSSSSISGLADSTVDISTTLLGVRLSYPTIPDKLELFGRLGIASSTATFSDFAAQGTTVGNTFLVSNTGDATFKGSGYGYGVGAEYFLEHVGFGAGLTEYNITYDTASGISASGGISPKLHENYTVIDLSVLYHF